MAKLTCSKKGISTIIGGFIFLVILVSAFTAFIVAFQIMTDLMEAQVKIGTESITKAREEFSVITSVKPSQGNRLYVQVENTGNTPIQISDAWIINKTSSPYAATRYEIAYQDSFIAPGSAKNIFKNTAVTLQNKYHDIKVVSSIGTMVTKELIVPLNPLRIDLITIPPNIRSGGNTTLAMTVYNRGNATVYNVAPTYQDLKANPPTGPPTNPSGSISAFSPASQSGIDLEPQEFAIFTWSLKLTGGVGTQTVFTNSATGKDSVTADTVVSNTDTANTVFISSPKKLFQSPELLVHVPNPFGESTDEGIWSLGMANPTDVDIQIFDVSFLIVPSTDSTKIVGQNCEIQQIYPTTGWSCPIDNLITWSSATPQTLKALDVLNFTARVEPKTSSKDEPVSVVIPNVYSSFGSFSAPTHVVGMRHAGTESIGNVYLTSVAASPLTNANIRTSLTGIQSGSVIKFNATLADFSSTTAHIAAGTDIIVIVPTGFTNVALAAGSTGFDSIVITPFPDGSTQVTANLTVAIGTVTTGSAVLKFTAMAPSVTSDATYTMFIIATGATGAGFDVAPVAEIPIQINN